jgi:hypothetical protein
VRYQVGDFLTGQKLSRHRRHFDGAIAVGVVVTAAVKQAMDGEEAQFRSGIAGSLGDRAIHADGDVTDMTGAVAGECQHVGGVVLTGKVAIERTEFCVIGATHHQRGRLLDLELVSTLAQQRRQACLNHMSDGAFRERGGTQDGYSHDVKLA